MKIIWKGAHSNNFELGRKVTVDRVVLHWIVGKLAAADAEFQKPSRQASAHYGVGNKVVHQYVKDEDTAYHCGNLAFNRRSIGIEHEGGPDIPITDETYASSAELVAQICKKFAIPLDRAHIVGHREVSATQCPGILDIDRIIREAKNISVDPQESPDLIACRADVKREIEAKEVLFREKRDELAPRIVGLERENKTHSDNWIKIAQALGTSASVAEMIGVIASLRAADLPQKLVAANNLLTAAKGEYKTLEASIQPLNEELRTLRPLKKENDDLKKEIKELLVAAKLRIISHLFFDLYIAKEIKEVK